MVDFTKGFSHSTELQKKISDLLQTSDIVQQKQKDLVTIFTPFSYLLVIFILFLENIMDGKRKRKVSSNIKRIIRKT